MTSNVQVPQCLIIMDGFGIAEPGAGNAISQADTPTLDALLASDDCVLLEASGEAVGLPDGQMGNSEVGHLNIGAGRVVFQELTKINRACRNGELLSNTVLQDVFRSVAEKGSTLHLMGLLSDGGVHSSNEHLYALMDAALQAGVKTIRIHCFMDGRDVAPSSGITYIEDLLAHIDDLSARYQGDIAIGSIEGRYYAMDRDNRWERVEAAYDAIVSGTPATDRSPVDVMRDSYADGVTDEFVVPIALDDRGIASDDGVIFFNFRPDRARQITRAIVDPAFTGFERSATPYPSFVCLTEYDPTIPAPVAFPKDFPENTLADVLSAHGLRQFHIAETEKYAHVTFFFNGGIEEPKEGEERCLVSSPQVATYDLQPEMSEPEVAQKLHDAIEDDAADVYIVNFANCDMVGHTGSIPAAVAAAEAVDKGVALVLQAMKDRNGTVFITADHGNADKMIADDGEPFTAHTTNPVPFALVDYSPAARSLNGSNGALCDIAPTMLDAIGIEKPVEMTGSSLLA